MFGNFRIVRKLGEGGMGVVYEAENPKISSRAVVKLLHPWLAEDDAYARRFLNEARAVNVIRHHGLVEIFDFGKLPDGTLYYVMELLAGDSLSKRIAQHGKAFRVLEAVGLGVQIARALAAAHKAGIVHRDLKPDNIMLEADPVNPGQDLVKILDFGIAKFRGGRADQADPDKTDVHTRHGSIMGTLLYMPPEQHGEAEQVDGRADVFSLGVVLYELLTGQPPFKESSLSLLIETPPTVRQRNAAVSGRLSKLVGRMMSVRRNDRPTMDEVALQLAAMQPGRAANLRRLVATGAAGLIVGALLIVLLTIDRVQTPAELRNRGRVVLAGYVHDQDPKIRLMAVRALGQSRDFDQRSLLEPLVSPSVQSTPDATALLEEAARALGQVGAADSVNRLLVLLSPLQSANVQLAAAQALAQLQHPRGVATLKQLFADGDALTKVQAALLLLDHRDLSGAQLLWETVERGRLSDEQRIDVLGRLARANDSQARRRLSEELLRLQNGELRVQVAYALAQLSEDSGWEYLKLAARKPGTANEQLLALRLLAVLGDQELRSKLVALAQDRKQPDSIREQAIAGLGDSAQHDSLQPLAGTLTERGASARLRIATAGAILEITAGELARLGEQSLNYARAALGTDSAALRALAVAALADINSERAIAPLGDALQDRERDIRRSAALALGKRPSRAAVQALTPALRDTDPEVRSLAMQSIGHVVQALEQRGDRETTKLVLAELRHLTLGDSEVDRIAASAALIQLGAAGEAERSILRNGLGSKETQARRLAVELGGGSHPMLVDALVDSDPGVRLAAARKLASQGLADGAQVLRTVAAIGDRDGLLAFVALRKLGQPAPTPPGLETLLTGGDVPTRLLVLDLLPELPAEDAQRLLRSALLNPVAQVRSRASEAAASLYRRTRAVTFLRMVHSLRNDSELIVRAHAAVLAEELAKELEQHPLVRMSLDLGPIPARTLPVEPTVPATKPVPPSPTGMGTLLAEGEDLVRFQIDKLPPQSVNGTLIPISVGKHRISYAGGSAEVQILPGKTSRVKIPASVADQLLQDGKDAIGRQDYQHAQEHLDRLRRLVQRGKASPSLQADLSFQQARLHESQQQFDAALEEYNRVLNIPESQRRLELNTALKSVLTRLSSRTGRIQIFTPIDGNCLMVREILSPPGQQVISVGPGQTRTVYSRVGSITKVTTCP